MRIPYWASPQLAFAYITTAPWSCFPLGLNVALLVADAMAWQWDYAFQRGTFCYRCASHEIVHTASGATRPLACHGIAPCVVSPQRYRPDSTGNLRVLFHAATYLFPPFQCHAVCTCPDGCDPSLLLWASCDTCSRLPEAFNKIYLMCIRSPSIPASSSPKCLLHTAIGNSSISDDHLA